MKSLKMLFIGIASICIFSSCGQETVVKPEDRIIMVNDRLYYGTTETGPMGFSDAIDGEILSTVKANEIPQKNGQSNFGEVGASYTYDADLGFIMVRINDEWCVFYASPSSSATSSPQSETTPPSSSNNIPSNASSSAASSGASSSEASPSSSSKSEVSQQQSSASVKEESATSSKTTELAGFVKDEQFNLYSKIVSCSIENDVMTVIFSSYAENPVDVNVYMDVWMSDDNSAGEVYETYSIEQLKEYSLSVSSFWFDENHIRGTTYMVNVYISSPANTVTTHRFNFRDGKIYS